MELYAKAGKVKNETVKRVSCYANVICRIEKPSPGGKKDSTEEDKWTLTTILIAGFVCRTRPKCPLINSPECERSGDMLALPLSKRAFWAAAVSGLCYPFVFSFLFQWRVFCLSYFWVQLFRLSPKLYLHSLLKSFVN